MPQDSKCSSLDFEKAVLGLYGMQTSSQMQLCSLHGDEAIFLSQLDFVLFFPLALLDAQ